MEVVWAPLPCHVIHLHASVPATQLCMLREHAVTRPHAGHTLGIALVRLPLAAAHVEGKAVQKGAEQVVQLAPGLQAQVAVAQVLLLGIPLTRR